MNEKDIEEHENATKIRTINFIEFGKHRCNAWYYSPYPAGYHHIDTLYICEYCLSFYAYGDELSGHSSRCKARYPPGDEIYGDS